MMARKTTESPPTGTKVLVGGVVLLAALLTVQLWGSVPLWLPPGHMEQGEAVANVPVIDITAERGRHRLREFASDSACTVLAFYHSTCPVCHAVAEMWRQRQVVELVDGNAPVVWISVLNSDTGATAFHDSFQLPGTPRGLKGRGSSRRLGVMTWPRFVIVDRDGNYQGEGPRSPDDYPANARCHPASQ